MITTANDNHQPMPHVAMVREAMRYSMNIASDSVCDAILMEFERAYASEWVFFLPKVSSNQQWEIYLSWGKYLSFARNMA